MFFERTPLLAGLLASLLCALVLTACAKDPPTPAQDESVTLGSQNEMPKVAPVPPSEEDILKGTYWPPAKLDGGVARISCEYDYPRFGEGQRLTSLEFFSLVDALSPCQARGVVRLRYQGKIGAGFTALVQRVSAMATRMEIQTRILDIDSSGGHVEEAIRAGDSIAESGWAIWVREDSVCHSACVLVLAAGDTRSVEGKVGIHRLMRDRSTATSRAELSRELRAINQQVRDYLERNGVATAVSDLMMTIANRDLRILTPDELKQYGLDGTNAAQDDLDRIRLTRKCGEDFVRRRDAFRRAFDAQCMATGKNFESMPQCASALQGQFGFPDKACPSDSPADLYARDLPELFPTEEAQAGDAAQGSNEALSKSESKSLAKKKSASAPGE
jgi:ATP-dependent protease ClpP protease subunit